MYSLRNFSKTSYSSSKLLSPLVNKRKLLNISMHTVVDRENDAHVQYFREFDTGDFSKWVDSDPSFNFLNFTRLRMLPSNMRLGPFASSGNGVWKTY